MARAVTARGGDGRTWARFAPVALVRTSGVDLAAEPGLRRALADGIERGYAGEIPAASPSAECFRLRAGGETVGLLVLERQLPAEGFATAHAIAVDPDRRGHAYGVKALLAAERRLAREGLELVGRVPRTNGRGLYFMLRAGFVPVAAGEVDAERAGEEATWFRRGTRARP